MGIRARIDGLVADASGNVGMMFAFALMPLMMATGIAIDYGQMTTAEGELARAADVAALAAISTEGEGFAAATAQKEIGRVDAAEQVAKRFFELNAASVTDAASLKATPVVTKEKGKIVAEIAYSADVNLMFGKLFGLSTMTIGGKARAEVAMARSTDFYMLLDNTPSMGVGATLTDIATLEANTKPKCAFACHQMDKTDNNYNLAKKLGVQMRIDVVRKATQRLTETAETQRQYPDQFRMAVYSFGARAESLALTQVAPLSSDLTGVRQKTGALDLMTIPYQNYFFDQLTPYDDTLKAIGKVIPKPGTGMDGDEPEKVLFFVSDGVADAYKPLGCKNPPAKATRCHEPIDNKQCEHIKKSGVKIAVLYTTYLPLPSDNWYNTYIAPFAPAIAPAMESCASPGLFFEVSPSEGIEEAMTALFLKTISTPRLTH